MKLNRLIYMNNTYKMSNRKICKLINVEMPDQMIKKNTLNLMHKLMIKKKPQSISNRIRENRHSRRSAKINLNLNLRTKKAKRSVLYRGIKLYNSIPTQLKSLSVKLFKKTIKKYHINEVADDWTYSISYYPINHLLKYPNVSIRTSQSELLNPKTHYSH